MTAVIVAIRQSRAGTLAAELELEGLTVIAVLDPASAALPSALAQADAVILPAERLILTPALLNACDHAGVRVLTLGDAGGRVLGRLSRGGSLPADSSGWHIAGALRTDPRAVTTESAASPHRITVVWGPHGAPGRSTVAVQLAAEFARRGRRTALVDADTVAPSLALLLGLGDEAPGIAAACRRADLGGLDVRELARLASPYETSGGTIDVLPGINRPSRWPELSTERLTSALQICRTWTQETIVDVSGAFDADDEATYDLVGPRRHAATTAALQQADAIVAVASADPVGISRFLRDHAEILRLTSGSPITVAVNRVRSGPLGIDPRGQVRRALERFAGITDVVFLPFDQRAADAALLHARVMADLTPRSPFLSAVRGLAASLLPTTTTAGAATDDSLRGSSRASRRPRSAPGSPAA